MHALLPWVGAAQEVFSGPQLATRVALSLCFKAATRLGLPAIYDVPSSWRGWYSLEIGVEITTAITLGFLVPTPRPSPQPRAPAGSRHAPRDEASRPPCSEPSRSPPACVGCSEPTWRDSADLGTPTAYSEQRVRVRRARLK